jgi:nucleotide-binding universal stress UspA family protein
VLVGNEADAILEVAQGEQVDLILMGTFGRSGLNRLLFGSVVNRVIHRAPCPVCVMGPEC